jgi:hypothetical protein
MNSTFAVKSALMLAMVVVVVVFVVLI